MEVSGSSPSRGALISHLQCCFQANSTCWNSILVGLTFCIFWQWRILRTLIPMNTPLPSVDRASHGQLGPVQHECLSFASSQYPGHGYKRMLATRKTHACCKCISPSCQVNIPPNLPPAQFQYQPLLCCGLIWAGHLSSAELCTSFAVCW